MGLPVWHPFQVEKEIEKTIVKNATWETIVKSLYPFYEGETKVKKL